MKARIVFYSLLTLVACKDGGKIVAPQSRPVGWAFDQALQTMSFSNGGSSSFAQNLGKQFTYSSGGTQFSLSPIAPNCIPVISEVQIDNLPVDFEPASCGVGLVRYFVNDQLVDTKEFYYITASRVSGNKVARLSFGFEGKIPKSAVYTATQFSFFSGYSMSEQNVDGSFKNYEYYYPLDGIVTTDASAGFRILADNLLMKGGSGSREQVKSFKVKMGCCSN
ncbi:MAG: hypothetical protein ACK5UP_15030 [Bacteroidota bacterium]|jgi:hypothetical protein|nr:hypothetical protein [Cytophagales bacterium]